MPLLPPGHQVPAPVTGVVLDATGKPLPGALVEGGGRQARTDAEGRFSLPAAGAVELRISAPGLESQVRQARPGTPLAVMLQAEASATVVVTDGSGYTSQEGTTSTLTRMDVYTTPGAAADVFQAVKGLPGVSNASEGAELFVRGGKPDEVGIYLNGGSLARPFHHPDTQGGIFSVVDTALVTRVDFVPGGFSARYGDALSAVLDLSTEVEEARRGGSLLLALPTQGVMAETSVGGAALRGSLRRGNPELLDKLYGLAPNFEESPDSLDGQVGWQQDLGPGRLQLTALGAASHLGVVTHLANQENVYENRSRSAYGAAQWRQALGESGALLLVASRDAFSQDWQFETWGIDASERTDYARAEVTETLGMAHTLEGGLETARLHRTPVGQVPDDLSDWSPGAAARTFAYTYDSRRDGAYLTWRWQLDPRWGLSLGGRTDRYGLPRETTHDLRGTLSFLLKEGLTLRASWGTFHQAPGPEQLDPYAGNSGLRVQRATHALLALDAAWKGAAAWNFRAELYRKDYDHLVREDPVQRYTSEGQGYAQGLDLFLKATRGDWRGFVGYSYLDTKRREGLQADLGPVPTSVPHNLTAVGAWDPRAGWELSLAWRYATGAPVTPIIGAVPRGSGFDPIEGPAYGDRLPVYHRADLRLTHLFAWKGLRTAAFAEVMNLLDRHNAASYSYSADFSQRRIEESYFSRRILVVGVDLSW
ncbi:MAG TPA: TonB-dependent receptor [Holophagaceae bacterium]|nr:TonB-dependent receptor [Holophagaceae bacterium]